MKCKEKQFLDFIKVFLGGLFFFLGKSCGWLSVDTALFILKENETQENLQLVGFTELQNEEVRDFWCVPILIVIF